MRRIVLFVVFYTFVIFSHSYVYSEEKNAASTTKPIEEAVAAMGKEKKEQPLDKKFLEEALDSLKKLEDAYEKHYKEMGKYQEPYYTYDRSFIGGVAYIGDKVEGWNVPIYFILSNETKNTFDVSRAGYFGVGKGGNIYRFDYGGVIDNGDNKNSPLAVYGQEIQLGCLTPFSEYSQAADLKEVYIKIHGKRIYFVPEKEHKKYLERNNIFLRKIRDFFRDIFQSICFSFWQFYQSLFHTNLNNFVKDYIRFYAAFSVTIDNIGTDKPKTELEAVKAMSKYYYEIKEAFRYLRPYLGNRNKVMQNIAQRVHGYINDMQKYWEDSAKASQNNNQIQSADLSGKAAGAQTSLINYFETSTSEILKLMSANPNANGTDFLKCNLSDKQLEQILSEINRYFGAEFEKIDFKNKQPEEIRMNKIMWQVYYVKTYAERALLENSKDKQP